MFAWLFIICYDHVNLLVWLCCYLYACLWQLTTVCNIWLCDGWVLLYNWITRKCTYLIRLLLIGFTLINMLCLYFVIKWVQMTWIIVGIWYKLMSMSFCVIFCCYDWEIMSREWKNHIWCKNWIGLICANWSWIMQLPCKTLVDLNAVFEPIGSYVE